MKTNCETSEKRTLVDPTAVPMKLCCSQLFHCLFEPGLCDGSYHETSQRNYEINLRAKLNEMESGNYAILHNLVSA